MKIRPVLLATSIVANIALVLAVTQRSAGWTTIFWPSQTTATAAPAKAPVAAKIAEVDQLDPQTWPALTGGDLATVAARLKAEGFPPSLQRAILSALVTQHFSERHKALAAMIGTEPWWRGNLFGSKSGAAILTTRQQLQRDEKEMLDQLLGVESGTSDYARAQQVRQFGDLPVAKLSELNRINSDYNELMSEVRNASQGILLPEDRDKLAFLEKEKRADIAKLLSPEELLEYDLRSSPTASNLRRQLAIFEPTQDEFRAIFKVQQASDAQFGGGSYELMTPEQRRQQGNVQKEVTAKLETVLSPERFAEYKEKTDSAYLQANALVTRLNLPATATAEIVAVQKDIMKRADTIRSDRALTPDERTSQLTALSAEAVTRLSPTLGETGIAAYKQSGGYWINMLQRPPTPAKKN
jgi:hypothetical protein